MRRIVGFCSLLIALACAPSARGSEDSGEFYTKLVTMLTNVDKSITILRQQISQSKKAGFAPDLQFELASLLSQKSTALYYIGKEKVARGEASGSTSGKGSPIVAAQKEAIAVLEQILESYPQYKRRNDVLYALAVGQNAIDEGPAFVRTVAKIKKEYAGTDNAVKASLLMGQYFFDKQDFAEALTEWKPIAHVEGFNEERNLARYRVGLALIRLNRDKEALGYFEVIAKDPDAAVDQSETRVSFDKQRAIGDIRREALLEAVIPYTTVHGTKLDPVKYFSSLAPSESIFQEVMEKLAFRYIYLKQYEFSIKLLRTLTQRMSDAQKILVIYYDVLRAIPLEARLEVSPEEMRYVLERLNAWQSYYLPDTGLRDQVSRFFEVQLRELGTRAHAAGKAAPKQRQIMLKAAEGYYKLYLAYFSPSSQAAAIGANLGDLYLERKEFLECGNYYLETVSGTYGPIKNKKEIIRNAFGCLDQKDESPYFEQVRKRGLLIRAYGSYRSIDPEGAKDPLLQFAFARATYENNPNQDGVDQLKKFIQANPRSKLATTAGEIMIDYYNSLEDFTGLAKATKFLSSAGIADAEFMKRVSQVQTQASAKALQEKVKTYGDYDDFAQGKSYLQAAVSADDSSLRSVALQTSLEKSRAEGDFDTFFKAAGLLGGSEQVSSKRASVLYSLAKERQNLGFYSDAFRGFLEVVKIAEDDERMRKVAFEEAINTALLAKDTRLVASLSSEPHWKLLGPASRRRVAEFLLDVLLSPMALVGDVDDVLADEVARETSLPTLIKAEGRLSSSLRGGVRSSLDSVCSQGRQRLACRWNAFLGLEVQYLAFRRQLADGSRSASGIEANAAVFQRLWGKYQELQGARDPDLESAIALRCRWLFNNFARYLEAVGKATPELRSVLDAKAKESFGVADKYRDSCKDLARKGAWFSPAARQCDGQREPMGTELYAWQQLVPARGLAESGGNPADLKSARRKVFSQSKSPEGMLELSEVFYRSGMFHHAAAMATSGSIQFPRAAGDFRAVLGCAVGALGLGQEALFHLQKADDYKGLKSECLKKLKQEAQ
jgi:tetratricopeptide (TPR) repeat protein